jgi:hypothetical protein
MLLPKKSCVTVLPAMFPKQRPPLPAPYRSIHAEHYRRNREGIGLAAALSRKMESWMHRRAAFDSRNNLTTLEIGAGSLNHIAYEPLSSTYDVVEELTDLCLNSPHRGRVRNLYGSVSGVTGVTYDRIISIASFEHFCNLPEVVATCGLLLSPGGRLRVAIPSEGTILWKAAWTMSTGIDFRLRYGLPYGVLMRYEHVNTAEEISTVLQSFFTETRRTVFGIRPSLSLYQFFECRNPILEECRRFSIEPDTPGAVSPRGRSFPHTRQGSPAEPC